MGVPISTHAHDRPFDQAKFLSGNQEDIVCRSGISERKHCRFPLTAFVTWDSQQLEPIILP